MCRKNLHGNVLHTEATKTDFETLNSRMISAPVLLIHKRGRDSEFVVVTDASKVGTVGVLLHEDISGSLRPRACWARKLKDCETRYKAYYREVLAVVEALSRVWRVWIAVCDGGMLCKMVVVLGFGWHGGWFVSL